MSARAEKVVQDARELAEELHADGQYRAADIIRRVCNGSATARSTMSALWKDNMELREVVARQAQRLASLESVEADAAHG